MVSHRKKDKNGFIKIRDNPISKIGVYPYLGSSIGRADKPNDIFMIYRPAEELASDSALDSLRLMPIIDDHEMLGEGATPAELKGIHGVVGDNVYFDQDTVFGDLKIYSDTLLDKIDIEGKKELSAGLWGDIEFMPGEYNGETYDGILKNITFNHVALVDHGRMGKQVRVLDEADKQEIETQPTGTKMNHLELLKKIGEMIAEFTAQEEAEPIAAELPVMDEEETEAETEEETASESESDKDDKTGVMDASDIDKIVTQKLNIKLADIRKRDDLYAKVKQHIGVMDSSNMTHAQLAQYAVKKLGIICDPQSAVYAIDGYLAASGKVAVQDAAEQEQQEQQHTNDLSRFA